MSLPSLTRREFLQSTSVAGAVAALSPFTPAHIWAQPTPGTIEAVPAWASKPQRWAQLTLVEDDPAHFDPAFWFDYFQRTRSDGVCLSGGGCVAFYPTDIPFHHRSQWLNNRDVLGELVSGCRKHNMSVLIRTDPHATYDDAKAAHPDWIAVDAQGNPRRHWSSPEMWVTCALGPYNFEFMTAVHKEIMSRYKPDGLFFNRWDGSGDCYCTHCRENFKAATGLDLPRTTNPQDPSRAGLHPVAFRTASSDLIDLWNTEIRKINPEASSIPNNGSGAHNPLDTIAISQRTPMLVADRQARRGLEPPWLMGKNRKGISLHHGQQTRHRPLRRRRRRALSLERQRQRQRRDSHLGARLHRQRHASLVQQILRHALRRALAQRRRRNLPLDPEKPTLPHPPATRSPASPSSTPSRPPSTTAATTPRPESKTTPSAGTRPSSNRASPSRWSTTEILDAAHLAPYKTLILPNIAALSDAQCDQLRAFVKNGGSLIATHETSLYDELGAPRKNFALADLFAVDFTGNRPVLRIRPPCSTPTSASSTRLYPRHVIFTGLEDAPRIINGVSRVEVTPRESFAETPTHPHPQLPRPPHGKGLSPRH